MGHFLSQQCIFSEKAVAFFRKFSYKEMKAGYERKEIMKTKEELNALKEEVEAVSKKLAELNEEELKLVTGGSLPPISYDEKYVIWKSLELAEDRDAAIVIDR